MKILRQSEYWPSGNIPVEDWYLQLVDDEIHIGNDGNVRFGNADRIHISWSDEVDEEITDKEDWSE